MKTINMDDNKNLFSSEIYESRFLMRKKTIGI